MAEAARFDQLRELFERHLVETETLIERIDECFEALGKTARAKACKGMMGLVDEGQELIAEGEKKEDAAADLASMPLLGRPCRQSACRSAFSFLRPALSRQPSRPCALRAP